MGMDSQLHTFVSSLSVCGVGIRAHTFTCRFAVWRDDLAAPNCGAAVDSLRFVFHIGLMEPYWLAVIIDPVLIANGLARAHSWFCVGSAANERSQALLPKS